MNAARRLRLRGIARQAQLFTRASELEYTGALRDIFGGLHAALVNALVLHAKLGTGRLDMRRTDGKADDPDATTHGFLAYNTGASAIEVHYLMQVPHKVGRAFDRMAPGLVRSTRQLNTLIGISPSEQGIADTVARAREASIELVEAAGRDYAADVRAVFADPANADLSVDELRRLLMERGRVSLSRADLIARDQVLKLSSAMNEQRQRNAGVAKYEWSGVMDVRERASHVELEGRVFGWDEETPIGYKPGQDYQCRCIPIPFIAELA